MGTQNGILRLVTTNPTVEAFEIRGDVSDDALEKMAETMNERFDEDRKVSMLLIFRTFNGLDWKAPFDSDVLEAQFRSLRNVDKYAVVGAPEAAEKLINFFGRLIPVDVRTFSAAEEDSAWDFVGASQLLEISA